MRPAEEGARDWSFTKSSLYGSCPRAFFFSRELTMSDEGEKGLPGRNAISASSLIGIAVHRSIAKQIEKWADGDRVDLKEAQAEAEAWITYVWDNAGILLIEAANGQQLDPGLLQRFVYAAKDRLHTFFMAIWPRFVGHSYVLHERLRRFEVAEHQVLVKVDLCTRDLDGNVVITDWKTGYTPLLEIDTPQLSVYAIWAMREYGVPNDKVIVQIANIKTGEILSRKPSGKRLEETKARIIKECREWERQNISNFPPNPSYDKCSSCRYLRICNAGQDAVGKTWE